MHEQLVAVLPNVAHVPPVHVQPALDPALAPSAVRLAQELLGVGDPGLIDLVDERGVAEPVVAEEAPPHRRVVDARGRGGPRKVAGLLQVLKEAPAGGGGEFVRGARRAANSLSRAREARLPLSRWLSSFSPWVPKAGTFRRDVWISATKPTDPRSFRSPRVRRQRVTREEVDAERARSLNLLQAFRQVDELPERIPLDVRERERREYESHTEIRLTYRGEPHERIPAYLLLPRVAHGRLPAVVAAHQCACLCDVGKEQVVGKCPGLLDQAYGLELVLEGFAVLAPDANKVGERFDPDLREQWERAVPERLPSGDWGQDRCCTAPGGSWGPVRWKLVHDTMRAVDLLCGLEEVDHTRIGMIGHSLGADTIVSAMPLEPRIQAAVISGGGIMPRNGFSVYALPYAELLRLIAPRPFFEVTGRFDHTNCNEDDQSLTADQRMAPKRAAHAAAREAYELLGNPDAIALWEFDGGHEFPEQARRAAYSWLKEQLG